MSGGRPTSDTDAPRPPHPPPPPPPNSTAGSTRRPASSRGMAAAGTEEGVEGVDAEAAARGRAAAWAREERVAWAGGPGYGRLAAQEIEIGR